MNFEDKNIDEFYSTIKVLSEIFKCIGSNRPYYTCEKICENYRKFTGFKNAEN